MAKTALELTRAEQQAYHPLEAIERRQESLAARIEERWQEAQELARQAAALLREEFGAEKVLLFGSLAARSRFTPWSDIDLAAWGVAPDRFYAAVAAVNDLNPDFRVDLVDPETCSPSLRVSIERDGLEL